MKSINKEIILQNKYKSNRRLPQKNFIVEPNKYTSTLSQVVSVLLDPL